MELGQADRMLPAPGNLERAELEAVDQPRARAHSTGAGSESGQGTEQSLRSVASRVRLEALTPEGTLQGAHSAAAALNSTSTMAPAIEQQEGSTSGQRLGSRQGSGQAPPASQRLEQGGQETAEGWPSNLTNRPEPGLAGPSGEAEAGPEPVSNENAYEMIATEAGANLQALRLLRKSSFTCTLLGARQTGKRTIVKCFVKLLNEFKLAADEYKKEKLLTKLVECSERLHQLQAEVGADGQVSSEGPEGPERRWGRTARLNSWLGMNKLRLNLSPGGKRRLHSVVGLWAPKEATDQQQQQQRRHTTFEPSLGPTATTSFINQQQQQQQRASGPRRFLGVQDARSAMLSCSNKSDSNLNYSVLATSEPQPPPPPPPPVASSSQQLCIHVPDAAQLTKRQSQSPGEPLLRATDRKPMNVPPQAAWRRHTNALVSISAAGTDRRPPTSTTGGRGRPAARKQSTAAALTKRRQRQLLSLKELNRRRCGIKFRTRRQISESCLEQLKRPVIDEIRRRASSLAPQEGPVESSSFASPAQLELPDAFLVVYSINDRLVRLVATLKRRLCYANN